MCNTCLMQVPHLCKVEMNLNMPPSYNMKGFINGEKRKRSNAELSIFSVYQTVIFPERIKKTVEYGKPSIKCCKTDKEILYAVPNESAMSATHGNVCNSHQFQEKHLI